MQRHVHAWVWSSAVVVAGLGSRVEAQPEASSSTPRPELALSERGLRVHQPGAETFELRLTFRVETLWALASNLDAMEDRTTDARFSIDRGRIGLDGHAFREGLQYKFEADFGRGAVTLKDLYFQGELAPGVWLRLGQFKRPFSRQQLTSSGRLEMPSRAITDDAFLAGRDIGLALHDRFERSPELEWAIGVFNGLGDRPRFAGAMVDPDSGAISGGAFSNVPTAWMPVFVGRIGYSHGELKGYSEADLEGGPLRYAVAASVCAETDFDRDSKRTHRAELDGMMKLDGFSVTSAVYGSLVQVSGSPTMHQLGFHLQAGKVIGNDRARIEPSARYAMVKAEGKRLQYELLIGLGWLAYGHNAKVTIAVGARVDDPETRHGLTDDLVALVRFTGGLF